jgi:hypothetical protein
MGRGFLDRECFLFRPASATCGQFHFLVEAVTFGFDTVSQGDETEQTRVHPVARCEVVPGASDGRDGGGKRDEASAPEQGATGGFGGHVTSPQRDTG